MIKFASLFMAIAMLLLAPISAFAAAPIVTDSRIRTYVYNPNEVFKLTTEYGYQSNIELAEGETVETLSLGDVSGFKITPEGNRIFLRALKTDFHTNMTLITNQRIYYFDLTSFVERNEDIIYVLRFYYPETDVDGDTGVPLNAAAYLRPAPREVAVAPASFVAPPSPHAAALPGRTPPQFGGFRAPPPQAVPAFSPPPFPSSPAAAASLPEQLPTGSRNLDYSLQGGERLAPWQVFDEKGRTFLKFSQHVRQAPPIYVVNKQGRPVPLPVSKEADYWVVNGVFGQFFIGQGLDQVTVFNEANAAVPNHEFGA